MWVCTMKNQSKGFFNTCKIKYGKKLIMREKSKYVFLLYNLFLAYIRSYWSLEWAVCKRSRCFSWKNNTYFSLLKEKVDIPYQKVIDYVNHFSYYRKTVCLICSQCNGHPPILTAHPCLMWLFCPPDPTLTRCKQVWATGHWGVSRPILVL